MNYLGKRLSHVVTKQVRLEKKPGKNQVPAKQVSCRSEYINPSPGVNSKQVADR